MAGQPPEPRSSAVSGRGHGEVREDLAHDAAIPWCPCSSTALPQFPRPHLPVHILAPGGARTYSPLIVAEGVRVPVPGIQNVPELRRHREVSTAMVVTDVVNHGPADVSRLAERMPCVMTRRAVSAGRRAKIGCTVLRPLRHGHVCFKDRNRWKAWSRMRPRTLPVGREIGCPYVEG